MSETTVNLEMPYILPSQAQKHVTHNEALQRLDAAVQLTIEALLSVPPEEAQEGDCYGVGEAPEGAWAGRGGKVAMRQDGAWIFLTPREGWLAWHRPAQRLLVHRDGDWQPVPLPGDAAFARLGVNAAADAVNRLALSAAASLFSHEGGGHQIKVNKAAAGDTASLLFQSNWTGHAEMGLAGDNEFAIKVSGGDAWTTALSISPEGRVRTPARPAARAWRSDGTMTPADGTQTGFDEIAALQGGFALGAAVSAGYRLTVPADGLYLLLVKTVTLSSSGFETALVANGADILAFVKGGASGAIAQTQTAFGLGFLAAGDTLSLSHAGNAQFQTGPGKTEIAVFML